MSVAAMSRLWWVFTMRMRGTSRNMVEATFTGSYVYWAKHTFVCNKLINVAVVSITMARDSCREVLGGRQSIATPGFITQSSSGNLNSIIVG